MSIYLFRRKTVLFSIYVLLLNSNAFGQETESDLSTSSGFKAGISYLSNYVYYGRQDSLKTPYFTPSLEYHHASGFYVIGSLSFLTGTQGSRLDYLNLDLGYEFTFNDQWKGGIYVEKSHYNSSSTNISSDIGASVGATVSYDAGFMKFDIGTDLLFSTKTDVMTNLSISKEIALGEESGYYLIPTLAANMSTQHFYEGYTSRKMVKNSNRMFPGATNVEILTSVDNPGFKLMDYEFSIMTGYEGNQWGWYLNPVFATPQNPIYTTTHTTLKLANGNVVNQVRPSTPLSEKNLSNLFFIDLGVYLNF